MLKYETLQPSYLVILPPFKERREGFCIDPRIGPSPLPADQEYIKGFDKEKKLLLLAEKQLTYRAYACTTSYVVGKEALVRFFIGHPFDWRNMNIDLLKDIVEEEVILLTDVPLYFQITLDSHV